jgi:hypothetical protein
MKKRITVTTLHEAAASLYEEGWRNRCFNAIAHLSLGYGTAKCKDTEVDYFETIAFFVKAVKEEGSRILILGTCPRSITSSWIKAAELVIKNSEVRVVIIPIACVVQANHSNPTVDGAILFVTSFGISRIEHPGRMSASEFVEIFSREAKQLDEDTPTG